MHCKRIQSLIQNQTRHDCSEAAREQRKAIHNNKNKNVLFQEGEAIIQTFLRKAKELATADMTAEQLYAEVQKLKAEVDAKENLYIKDVLARQTVS